MCTSKRVCVCVWDREREIQAWSHTDKGYLSKNMLICSLISSLAIPQNLTVIVYVCASESLIKKLTFSPQDVVWKLSRLGSPNVFIDQSGDWGGILVMLDSSLVVLRICLLLPLCLQHSYYFCLVLELKTWTEKIFVFIDFILILFLRAMILRYAETMAHAIIRLQQK